MTSGLFLLVRVISIDLPACPAAQGPYLCGAWGQLWAGTSDLPLQSDLAFVFHGIQGESAELCPIGDQARRLELGANSHRNLNIPDVEHLESTHHSIDSLPEKERPGMLLQASHKDASYRSQVLVWAWGPRTTSRGGVCVE